MMASTATQLTWGQRPATEYVSAGNHSESKDRTALVVAAGTGDRTAFEELYQQSAPRVLKTLYRITRNREDAEDALQEASLNAFVHAKDFDGRSSFATWFTRIAINSALMILRKKRTHPQQSIDDGGETGVSERNWIVPESATNPERLYAQTEREGILKAAVGDLRPTIRKAVELGQLQERSMRETADVLGISVAAAKARLFHARAALRRSRRLKSMKNTWFVGRDFRGCGRHGGNMQQHA